MLGHSSILSVAINGALLDALIWSLRIWGTAHDFVISVRQGLTSSHANWHKYFIRIVSHVRWQPACSFWRTVEGGTSQLIHYPRARGCLFGSQRMSRDARTPGPIRTLRCPIDDVREASPQSAYEPDSAGIIIAASFKLLSEPLGKYYKAPWEKLLAGHRLHLIILLRFPPFCPLRAVYSPGPAFTLLWQKWRIAEGRAAGCYWITTSFSNFLFAHLWSTVTIDRNARQGNHREIKREREKNSFSGENNSQNVYIYSFSRVVLLQSEAW